MNAKVEFRLEWEDPGQARGEELRATWCRLAIQIGDTFVTRVSDERAQTVRDAIYCSAYPLAEWFAFNWWPLLNELERPIMDGFAHRHNLRFAQEGFVLPDLEFITEGLQVRAVWKAFRPTAAPVQFLDSGSATLDKEAFASEIRSFVEKVCARLKTKEVKEAPLLEEWQAVTTSDKDETEFCEATGALGFDPYSLDENRTREILSVEAMLPSEIRGEFFFAAAPELLKQQARWIKKCIDELRRYEIKTSLAGKRGVYSRELPSKAPWELGYEIARKFRKDFKLRNEKSPLKSEEICGVKRGTLPIVWAEDERPLDGVAMLDPDYGPQLATAKVNKRESSRKYLLARSLCEYLCTSKAEGDAALLTSVRSDRQKRNRAFAAELLAPSTAIRKQLSGARVTLEEVSEIAHHYDVSEWLIQHQIRNHQLAEIDGLNGLSDPMLAGFS